LGPLKLPVKKSSIAFQISFRYINNNPWSNEEKRHIVNFIWFRFTYSIISLCCHLLKGINPFCLSAKRMLYMENFIQPDFNACKVKVASPFRFDTFTYWNFGASCSSMLLIWCSLLSNHASSPYYILKAQGIGENCMKLHISWFYSVF
jgi:hypothetical protein